MKFFLFACLIWLTLTARIFSQNNLYATQLRYAVEGYLRT